MPHVSAEAFILGTHPLREKDRIVAFLTREHGVRRGVARGARASRSAFGGALEPMTEARVSWFEKEGRELSSLDSVDPTRPSFPLTGDLPTALLLPSLAEALQTFVADNEPAEPFYRLARHAMDALFGGASASHVSAYFDLWVLKLSGLLPIPSECASCAEPLPPSGPLDFDETRPGFVCAGCRGAGVLRLSAAGAAALRSFLTHPISESPAPAAVLEVAEVARRARRHFLGHELRSRRVLSAVLGGPR
ncbi:MAG TPA: DNA repair protein RecO [Thermoanaerobaculia bacterium]|jgi:DNA repair protein RecO (recombination protein O)